jgi:hypothetical protein
VTTDPTTRLLLDEDVPTPGQFHRQAQRQVERMTQDAALAADLIEAQTAAVETSCPMCLGRGQVMPGPRRGEYVVRLLHFTLCPRRRQAEER